LTPGIRFDRLQSTINDDTRNKNKVSFQVRRGQGSETHLVAVLGAFQNLPETRPAEELPSGRISAGEVDVDVEAGRAEEEAEGSMM
jgi:hypothetical protein